MDEVKNEIFGSRNKWLNSILKQYKINFIENIWVATCRSAINNDIQSRYAVFIEEGSINVDIFQPYIPIYKVSFISDKITFINLRNSKSATTTYTNFVNGLTKKMNCEFIESTGSTFGSVSNFSSFFRTYMGKGFSLTDIDYYLPEYNLILEEKNYTNDDKILLGLGQFFSIKEIIKDVIINSRVIFFANNMKEIYYSDFSFENTQILDENWGKMIAFRSLKIEKTEFEKLIKNE